MDSKPLLTEAELRLIPELDVMPTPASEDLFLLLMYGEGLLTFDTYLRLCAICTRDSELEDSQTICATAQRMYDNFKKYGLPSIHYLP